MTQREFLEWVDAHLSDNREFMRELILRSERVERRLQGQSDQIVARLEAGTKVLDDLHEASKDHTRAIANLIDELRRNGLGGSPA